MKILLSLFLFFSYTIGQTIDQYVKELNTLDKNQSMALVLAYWYGKKHGFELTLTAIVWKESSFGRHLSNSRDGKYGSFGIAQILLETAMARLGHETPKERRDLKARLLTDHVFNLTMAIEELNYWKFQHRIKSRKKFWLTHTIASYNAGWRSVYNPKGKKYATDVLTRIKALKRWFRDTKEFKHRVAVEHLNEIKHDLIINKVIQAR